ncbi:MAG TPA: hypothetical protein VNU92_07460 [Edaphobacter sp.]|nr:hypothetical protein [Edaphobacter sp.]
MKIRFVVSVLGLAMGSIAYGQAVPAGTSMTSSNLGPNLPNLDGVLHYAVSASEVVQFGYYGDGVVTHSTALSGDVAYTAKSVVYPFSALVNAGVLLGNSSGQGTGYFTSATVSQGLITRHWNFNVSDSVSALPQSPTLGLSGIAGTGDLGSLPVQGPSEGPAGGILSNGGKRVANTLSGGVERMITRNTSLSGGGSWSILHFPDNTAGLDSSQVTGEVALNRRLDARSSVSLSAVYSTFGYKNGNSFNQPDIETRGLNLSYQRVLTRTLSVSVSAGPQWVSSSNSTLIPSSLNAAASASLSYQKGLTSASLSYTRGVNAGSGVLPGALSDSYSGFLGHTFGRKWVASLSANYSHTDGLTHQFNGTSPVSVEESFNTVYGGGQVTRSFTSHISGYASYTVQHQASNFSTVVPANATIGTSQTFGVGVTYSPRSTRLGQF